jgi:hypothetical protein
MLCPDSDHSLPKIAHCPWQLGFKTFVFLAQNFVKKAFPLHRQRCNNKRPCNCKYHSRFRVGQVC